MHKHLVYVHVGIGPLNFRLGIHVLERTDFLPFEEVGVLRDRSQPDGKNCPMHRNGTKSVARGTWWRSIIKGREEEEEEKLSSIRALQQVRSSPLWSGPRDVQKRMGKEYLEECKNVHASFSNWKKFCSCPQQKEPHCDVTILRSTKGSVPATVKWWQSGQRPHLPESVIHGKGHKTHYPPSTSTDSNENKQHSVNLT